MSRPIRWAVIGAGAFARTHMGPAIHAAEGAQLVAIGTSDPAKAAPFQAFAGDLIVGNHSDIIASDEVDAVYIATPNTTHTPLSLRAIEAGKHVLCEKPVSMTVAELDTLIAARDASGMRVAEAYMVLHHPQWHRARTLVSEGALGEVLHIESVFSFGLSLGSGNIRLDAAQGGGALRDIGVYPIGVTRYVMDADLSDISSTSHVHAGVDLATSFQARVGGATMATHLDMRLSRYQHITFHGRDAALRLTAPFNAGVHAEAILTLTRGSEATIERFPTVNQYKLQVEAFGDHIRTGEDYAVPLEFSRGTQVAIDQMLAGIA